MSKETFADPVEFGTIRDASYGGKYSLLCTVFTGRWPWIDSASFPKRGLLLMFIDMVSQTPKIC